MIWILGSMLVAFNSASQRKFFQDLCSKPICLSGLCINCYPLSIFGQFLLSVSSTSNSIKKINNMFYQLHVCTTLLLYLQIGLMTSSDISFDLQNLEFYDREAKIMTYKEAFAPSCSGVECDCTALSDLSSTVEPVISDKKPVAPSRSRACHAVQSSVILVLATITHRIIFYFQNIVNTVCMN